MAVEKMGKGIPEYERRHGQKNIYATDWVVFWDLNVMVFKARVRI